MVSRFSVFSALIVFMLSFSTAQAAPRKVRLAVLNFNSSQLGDEWQASLTSALLASLEKSGKFTTRGENDIRLVLSEIKKQQLSSEECMSDENCNLQLGRDLNVDYVLSPAARRLPGLYLVSLRAVRITRNNNYPDVPTIQQTTADTSGLLKTTGLAAAEFAGLFALEGNVTALSGERAVINLGQNHGLTKGDTLYIEREKAIKDSAGKVQFTDRIKVGQLEVIRLQPGSAMCKIDSSRLVVQEGDIVFPDPAPALQRLVNEQREVAERLARARREDALARGEYIADAFYLGLQAGGGGAAALGEEKHNKSDALTRPVDTGRYDNTLGAALNIQLDIGYTWPFWLYTGLSAGYTMTLLPALEDRPDIKDVYPVNSTVNAAGDLKTGYAGFIIGRPWYDTVMGSGMMPYLGAAVTKGKTEKLRGTAEYFDGKNRQAFKVTAQEIDYSGFMLTAGLLQMFAAQGGHPMLDIAVQYFSERVDGSGPMVLVVIRAGWSF